MFALDVSREVEGYVAEASIRSRHLKTEAGDIPGVEGKGKMCGSARRHGERWKASWGPSPRHNNLLREEEPVYKHRLLIQPQYIEANSRRIREKLQEWKGDKVTARVDIISWILPPSSTSWTAFTSTRLRTPPGQTTTNESPQWFSRDLSRGTPPQTPWSLSPTGGKPRGNKLLSSKDFEAIENYESQDRKMREDDGEGGGEGCAQMRRRQGEQ